MSGQAVAPTFKSRVIHVPAEFSEKAAAELELELDDAAAEGFQIATVAADKATGDLLIIMFRQMGFRLIEGDLPKVLPGVMSQASRN